MIKQQNKIKNVKQNKLVYVVIYFSSQVLLSLSIRPLTNLYICNYIFMIDGK